MMNKLVMMVAVLLVLKVGAVNGQVGTYSNIDLTGSWDQIRFKVNDASMYYLMSKPSIGVALGLYSPDNGGWYWRTDETTGGFKLLKGGLSIEGKNTINSVNGFHNAIEFVDPSNASIVFKPGTADELMFGFHSNGNFYWGTGQVANSPNYYSMFLNGDTGNLGIKGKLTANEVVVKSGGWADYVFKPSYKLMPLLKVEEYIKAHGHLPNIPTEKEVLENGVMVGEMNVKLLEKVEELTLYIIELEKRVKELEK